MAVPYNSCFKTSFKIEVKSTQYTVHHLKVSDPLSSAVTLYHAQRTPHVVGVLLPLPRPLCHGEYLSPWIHQLWESQVSDITHHVTFRVPFLQLTYAPGFPCSSRRQRLTPLYADNSPPCVCAEVCLPVHWAMGTSCGYCEQCRCEHTRTWTCLNTFFILVGLKHPPGSEQTPHESQANAKGRKC